MNRQELDIAVAWANQEGWNPGLYDADSFYAQDPNGFFIGLLGDDPIATISGVRYGETYGFSGFYIVKKEHRNEGYGIEIFKKMMAYLGDRNIGGDGVLENLEKYASVGFKLAHLNARYQGLGSGTGKISPNVENLLKFPFEDVAAYDNLLFGVARRDFLKSWIDQPEGKTFGYAKGGKLMGYGVIRRCFRGYKIGPLFADNKEIAKSLFDTLAGQIDKEAEVILDTPECNPAAVKMAADHGMKKVFATGRVYTKGQPNFPLERWFGVTTFELG